MNPVIMKIIFNTSYFLSTTLIIRPSYYESQQGYMKTTRPSITNWCQNMGILKFYKILVYESTAGKVNLE